MATCTTKELPIQTGGVRGMVEVGPYDTLAKVRLKIVEQWDDDMLPAEDFCLWVGPTRLSRKQEARKRAWDCIGAVDTSSASASSKRTGSVPMISLQAKQTKQKSPEMHRVGSSKKIKQGSDTTDGTNATKKGGKSAKTNSSTRQIRQGILNTDHAMKTKKGNKRAKPVMPTRNTSAKKGKTMDQPGVDPPEKWQSPTGGLDPQAKLSYYIDNLADLWKEYTHGIGGRKPARYFTPEEIDRVKDEYHRRKVVWDVISKHVHAGYHPVDAMNRIYRAYGPFLITAHRTNVIPTIIAAIEADVPKGGHPDLQANKVRLAELSKHPRSLEDLWTEYTDGLGGRKPAREFTAAERGAVKYMYSQRKKVWSMIEKHVQAGCIAPVAIHKIYQVYGAGASVSTIIRGIRQDDKTGGHPTLRLPYVVPKKIGKR